MGTPDFAVESLKALVENGYEVVAVVTMPDKAVGRHHETLQASPVKQYAVAHGIPVLQPEKLKNEGFLQTLREYKADVQVVVAFRMLPEVVWAMPPMGTFNLHAALLPKYRGAAPINWAVINGEKETGITTFFLDHDIDTGRIIHRVAVPIAETDTAGDVHDKLMYLGADLVRRTIDDLAHGHVETISQDELIAIASRETDGNLMTATCPAPKLFKENTQIRWHEHTVTSAYNFIRGLSPYPTAWTMLRTADGKETPLKIFFAEKVNAEEANSLNEATKQTSQNVPGALLVCESRHQAGLYVRLTDGYLRFTELQVAGKRRMNATDFLRGAHLEGARLIEV